MNIIVSETQFIGKNLIFFKTLPSTNDFAKELIAKSKPKNGSVILAENQTNGRGQAGNNWLVENGKNITCSIILDTSGIEVKQQFILNMLIAIAVRQSVLEFLDDNSKKVMIKWPNDILVNHKKIAGILLENSLQGKYLQNSIIGIGININQNKFEKNINATSTYLEINKECDVTICLKKLFINIEKMYYHIQNEQYIKNEYYKYLYNYNELKKYIYNNNTIEAKIIGVNDFGQLLIEYDNKVIAINQKEIQYIIEK